MAMLAPPLPRPKPQMLEQPPQQPPQAFVWGADGRALSPEEVQRQRAIAQQLIQSGTDTSPIGSWTQGAARVANALVGQWKERRANESQSEGLRSAQDALAAYQSEESDPAADPKAHIAHALALADNPWLGDGARAVLLQSLKRNPNEWQSVDQDGDGKPDVQRNTTTGEIKSYPNESGPFGSSFMGHAAEMIAQGEKNPEIRNTPGYKLAVDIYKTMQLVPSATGEMVPLSRNLPTGFGGGSPPQTAPAAPTPTAAPTAATPPAAPMTFAPRPGETVGAPVQPGSAYSVGAPITGTGSKPNEQQLKDQTFYVRMAASEDTLSDKDAVNRFVDWTNAAPREMGVGFMQSGPAQQVQQAGDEWVSAILRKDSGAAVPPAELTNYRRLFIPQWGDKPELIAQKAISRRRMAEAVQTGLTPAQAIKSLGIVRDNSNPATAAPSVHSQQEFDALPSGTEYIEPDGKRYRKP